MNKSPNRLIKEKSPYLLQHAYNPVDWYPWCDEAFEKAKRENKPVFFSSGYSTCHWCHVMAHECFESEEIAEALNSGFVAIKVDREERPDIDHVYMSACQAMTRSGGWPLTILMTSEGKPFFAGTYFPPHTQAGRPGLLEVLTAARAAWENQRDGLEAEGEQLVKLLASRQETKQDPLQVHLLQQGYEALERSFDPKYGGFGAAPKFLVPQQMLFLLRYWQRTGKDEALEMVIKTLQGIRQGGIYDHLGGGISRYSTDERWQVPHFEKMLYDNALIAAVGVEVWQITRKSEIEMMVREILDYLLRDMVSPERGFYSAEDADSEGVEGKYYSFTRDEIYQVLSDCEPAIFAEFYQVTEEGNWEDGRNILHCVGQNKADFAARRNLKVAELERILTQGRQRLFAYQRQRVRPFRDDKILTGWNALAIVAFAKAARAFQHVPYHMAAEEGMGFLLSNLVREDGRWLARFREGEAAHLAGLDDYAYVLWALLELYQATFEPEYLRQAVHMGEEILRLFADPQGGFFLTGTDGESLIIRPKELYDGAAPAGNSVAVYGLLRLARLVGREDMLLAAEKALQALKPSMEVYPEGFCFSLINLQNYFVAAIHAVVAGDPDEDEVQNMLRLLGETYLPEAAVILQDGSYAVENLLPYVKNQTVLQGKVTAYLCENFTCRSPLYTVDELHNVLVREGSKNR